MSRFYDNLLDSCSAGDLPWMWATCFQNETFDSMAVTYLGNCETSFYPFLYNMRGNFACCHRTKLKKNYLGKITLNKDSIVFIVSNLTPVHDQLLSYVFQSWSHTVCHAVTIVAWIRLEKSCNHITNYFQNVLSFVSKATKASLGKIGVFTVTSFHALVCARTPLTTANMYGSKSKKRGLLSTFKADSVTKIRPKSPRSFNSPQGGYVLNDFSAVLIELKHDSCVLQNWWHN